MLLLLFSLHRLCLSTLRLTLTLKVDVLFSYLRHDSLSFSQVLAAKEHDVVAGFLLLVETAVKCIEPYGTALRYATTTDVPPLRVRYYYQITPTLLMCA